MLIIKPTNKKDLNKTFMSFKLNNSKKEIHISVKQFAATTLAVVVMLAGSIYYYGQYRINTEMLNKTKNDLKNVSATVEEQYDAEIKDLEKKAEEIEKQIEVINSTKENIESEIDKIDKTSAVITKDSENAPLSARTMDNNNVAEASFASNNEVSPNNSFSRLTLLSSKIESLNTKIEQKETEFLEVSEQVTVLVKDILSKPSLFPTNGMISSEYGYRDGAFHAGVDIRAPKGTPIIATASGTVEISGNAPEGFSGYGNVIMINHGSGYKTLYAHNKQNSVKVGQRVEKGDVIGYVGSTGYSTGNHVHYEVRVNGENVNPRNYF